MGKIIWREVEKFIKNQQSVEIMCYNQYCGLSIYIVEVGIALDL